MPYKRTLTALDNRKHYGELVTMHLGRPIIVLNSADAVNECFIKNANDTSEREGKNTPLHHITKGIHILQVLLYVLLLSL